MSGYLWVNGDFSENEEMWGKRENTHDLWSDDGTAHSGFIHQCRFGAGTVPIYKL